MKALRNNNAVKLLAAPVALAIMFFTFTCCCISNKAEASPVSATGILLKNAVKKTCGHCPTSRTGSPIRPCCAKIMPASVDIKHLSFAATPAFQFALYSASPTLQKLVLSLPHQYYVFSSDHPPDFYQQYSNLRL
jgi:hypothetical protein